MKGTITTCLAEMVEQKHGSAAWAQIIEEAEVDPKTARLLMLPARQAIVALDGIHVRMTSMMENASPPRFDYAEIDDRTLDVTYKSKRNLLPVYVGLAKGLGKFFRETVAVTVIDRDRVRIEFGAAK